MKITTVKEFRDKATQMLRSEEPIVITRNGKAAGLYIPISDGEMPLRLKKMVFRQLAEDIKKQREQKGVTEDEILADFEAFRQAGS